MMASSLNGQVHVGAQGAGIDERSHVCPVVVAVAPKVKLLVGLVRQYRSVPHKPLDVHVGCILAEEQLTGRKCTIDNVSYAGDKT